MVSMGLPVDGKLAGAESAHHQAEVLKLLVDPADQQAFARLFAASKRTMGGMRPNGYHKGLPALTASGIAVAKVASAFVRRRVAGRGGLGLEADRTTVMPLLARMYRDGAIAAAVKPPTCGLAAAVAEGQTAMANAILQNVSFHCKISGGHWQEKMKVRGRKRRRSETRAVAVIRPAATGAGADEGGVVEEAARARTAGQMTDLLVEQKGALGKVQAADYRAMAAAGGLVAMVAKVDHPGNPTLAPACKDAEDARLAPGAVGSGSRAMQVDAAMQEFIEAQARGGAAAAGQAAGQAAGRAP